MSDEPRVRSYIRKAHDDFKNDAIVAETARERKVYEECRQRMEAILLRLDSEELEAQDTAAIRKAGVLETAHDIIHGDRPKHYGHPSINFNRIAQSWSQYKSTEITPMDVCVMMILLKAQRMAEGYHRDSVIDIGGYAALAAIVSGDEEL